MPVPNAARAGASIAAGLLLAFTAYSVSTGHQQVAEAAPAATAPTPPTAPGGPSGVEVVGTGKVAGTPDVLRLDLQVSTTRPAAAAGLGAASSAMAAVVKALRAHRVGAKDIKTTDLSLQPEYDYSNGTSVLRGYTGSEDVAVTLRDLRTAGAVITAATAAGGNAARVQGVSLDLDSDSALLASARDAAFADARTKALGYARAAGRSLGPVTVISEDTTAPAPIPLDAGALRSATTAESTTPVPVQPGSQQVSVSVRVTWSFG